METDSISIAKESLNEGSLRFDECITGSSSNNVSIFKVCLGYTRMTICNRLELIIMKELIPVEANQQQLLYSTRYVLTSEIRLLLLVDITDDNAFFQLWVRLF